MKTIADLRRAIQAAKTGDELQRIIDTDFAEFMKAMRDTWRTLGPTKRKEILELITLTETTRQQLSAIAELRAVIKQTLDLSGQETQVNNVMYSAEQFNKGTKKQGSLLGGLFGCCFGKRNDGCDLDERSALVPR